MTIPTPIILDISEWQVPSSINYDQLAKSVDGVIVRIQYGSNYIDKHYKTHIVEFQKRGIPVAVYAWVRGISNSDMEKEATDFYNRAKAYNPSFWWLDVEEKSMGDMRTGVEKYRAKLKSLGAKKVGAYIANHLYASFNLDTSKFDGIWIPTYGSNNGQYNGSNPTATSNYDIHQYTSNGKLSGYSGSLDLNRIVRKGFDYFFGKTSTNNLNQKTNNTSNASTGGKIKMKTVTLKNNVNLRASASTSGKIIATLKKGNTVKFDDIVTGSGYIWGVQPRTDSYKKGYIAIGKISDWGNIL
ncbi:GH25 family lysozyme [Enterococcus gallinarum]|uniref:GH25 family lysozyme n=1 Tax=Enterococcus gallinarum TaxID=1353 RepID=UPI00214C36C0|nr:GH25 family lysozyme [Enterococcus gallinarum]MCR1930918.1 glycoside hydrolase family 25 [Enterococcus gallinarum]